MTIVSSINIIEIQNKLKLLPESNLVLLGNAYQNVKKGKGLPKNLITESSGVYAFWWVGNKKEFIDKALKCNYKLKGKRSENELIQIKFTEDWIKAKTHNNNICLYIGKATNIKSRVSKHIKIKTANIWNDIKMDSGRKPNSESQLRIGIERILNNKDMRDKILKNISLSWVELNGYINGVNRFYLEDIAIGTYFPLFNVDIER